MCVRVYSCHHKGANQFAHVKTVLMLAHSTYIEARPLLMLREREREKEWGSLWRYEMCGGIKFVCVSLFTCVCVVPTRVGEQVFFCCLVVFKCQMQCVGSVCVS